MSRKISDKERLDWLTKNGHKFKFEIRGAPGYYEISQELIGWSFEPIDETFSTPRQAIDAVIRFERSGK